jgi:DNA-binding transcriptional MerR regulator
MVNPFLPNIKEINAVAKPKRQYKAKEVCSIFDISKVTLFRWEKEGFISSVGRDWRNWRLYSEKNIQEIKKMIRLRNEKRN